MEDIKCIKYFLSSMLFIHFLLRALNVIVTILSMVIVQIAQMNALKYG